MVASYKTLRAWLILINLKVYGFIWLYTLFTNFIIIQKYITSYHMLLSLYIFFTGNIFNNCIRCIFLYLVYNMHNVYWTTLQCNYSIGLTPRYQKWPIVCHFIFLCSVIKEHDFISYFEVVVNFLLFSQILSSIIFACFLSRINYQSTLYLSG